MAKKSAAKIKMEAAEIKRAAAARREEKKLRNTTPVSNGDVDLDYYASVDQAWVEGEFIATVQQRGAAIIKARGLSSAASAANAAVEHMRDWVAGTNGEVVSMGIYSDGSYGITERLIYSFPCVCENGDWKIVQDLEISDFSREKMSSTEKELIEERDAVQDLLPS